MYATVRTYTGAAELADALVEHAADIEALIGGIDGFKAYYFVRTADGAASISVFENEAGAAASTTAAASWIGENLPGLGIAPSQISSGEVAVSF
jgi:hypothetical protein